MSKNYYIFRHGETFATRKKRWYWNKLYSATILEEGKPSVLRLADYLKKIATDYNVSSPFLRCRQTVEIVSTITGKEFEFDARIGEHTFELPWTYENRVLSFTNEMENSDKQNILICTHGVIIQMLMRHFVKDGITLKEHLAAPLPGVLTIIKDGKLKEIDFNKQS